MSRSAKLILILLVPALLYGAAKGLAYYQAKKAVDDFILAMANHADVRYAGLITDLRGAVTVEGITVQARDSSDSVDVASVRISSDDPMFFIQGLTLGEDEAVPPHSLAFSANGIKLPLDAAMLQAAVAPRVDEPAASTTDPQAPEDAAATDVQSKDDAASETATVVADIADSGMCAQGLHVDPAMLQQLGFSELVMDLGGRYDYAEASRDLELAFELDMHHIESVRIAAHLADVDLKAMAAGSAPQLNLSGFSVAVTVEPAFGNQMLKACAIGTEQPVQLWSERVAQRALDDMQAQGLMLGDGLSTAMRRFYKDWGEFKVEAQPAKPVGLLSLMFVPPEQLVPMLGLRISLNEQPIDDISFEWQRTAGQGLGALMGQNDEVSETGPQATNPARVIVRREFVNVPVASIRAYVDREVRIKPRGQPLREGVLKRVADGEAEVEQPLHGGKFTVYVPVSQIETIAVLELRKVTPGGG